MPRTIAAMVKRNPYLPGQEQQAHPVNHNQNLCRRDDLLPTLTMVPAAAAEPYFAENSKYGETLPKSSLNAPPLPAAAVPRFSATTTKACADETTLLGHDDHGNPTSRHQQHLAPPGA